MFLELITGSYDFSSLWNHIQLVTKSQKILIQCEGTVYQNIFKQYQEPDNLKHTHVITNWQLYNTENGSTWLNMSYNYHNYSQLKVHDMQTIATSVDLDLSCFMAQIIIYKHIWGFVCGHLTSFLVTWI